VVSEGASKAHVMIAYLIRALVLTTKRQPCPALHPPCIQCEYFTSRSVVSYRMLFVCEAQQGDLYEITCGHWEETLHWDKDQSRYRMLHEDML
jgi:hypothetical protein